MMRFEKIDYLDLYLIHDPLSGKEKRLAVSLFVITHISADVSEWDPTRQTWRALIKRRDEGKLKSIGVSN
jgi:diketogulonate reductase-like aldo/keto reductase